MHRIPGRILLIVAAFALFLVPIAAIAAGGFDDVSDGNVFKADIQWMKDAGVTKGCNPPANTKFCPGDNVTREQMSAFMHRLAVNKVVDAKTAVTADSATNADKLDGKDSTAFLGKTAKAADSNKLDGKDSTAFAGSGHDHDADYLAMNGKATDSDKLDGKNSTAFLTKAVYDTNEDGFVDSAEIKIRYAGSTFDVDMDTLWFDRMQCVTDQMTLGSATTVVVSGGLSLQPNLASNTAIYGYAYYKSIRAGSVWVKLSGRGIEDTPGNGSGGNGTGDAGSPIDGVGTLNAGIYRFAISSFGANLQAGNDYSGLCELTVTAYAGQGASTDVAWSAAEPADDDVHKHPSD